VSTAPSPSINEPIILARHLLIVDSHILSHFAATQPNSSPLFQTLGGKKGKSDREIQVPKPPPSPIPSPPPPLIPYPHQLNALLSLHSTFVTKLEYILRLIGMLLLLQRCFFQLNSSCRPRSVSRQRRNDPRGRRRNQVTRISFGRELVFLLSTHVSVRESVEYYVNNDTDPGEPGCREGQSSD
jgi:hypothetical protein